MDGIDTVFAQRLRQKISDHLNGTQDQGGLYQLASHRGVRSWEEYQYLLGRINGLEIAAQLVDEVLRQIVDGADHDRSVRAGLN